MAGWSYYVLSTKNLLLEKADPLQVAMTRLGTDGWELAAATTTVKSWANLSGNDLVFVFKKEGLGHVPPAIEYDHALAF